MPKQDETQGKLDLTNTALLAAIAHKFVVGDELPKVPYRTLLDYYVDTCFILQFVVVMSIFVLFYVDKNRVLEGSIELFPWRLNWILLGFNVFVYLCVSFWVLLKWHFVVSDVEHWMRISEHISAGLADAETDNIMDIHHMTLPKKPWGIHFFHKHRTEKSKFLHFGGHKKAHVVEPGSFSVKSTRGGGGVSSRLRSPRVYAAGAASASSADEHDQMDEHLRSINSRPRLPAIVKQESVVHSHKITPSTTAEPDEAADDNDKGMDDNNVTSLERPDPLSLLSASHETLIDTDAPL